MPKTVEELRAAHREEVKLRQGEFFCWENEGIAPHHVTDPTIVVGVHSAEKAATEFCEYLESDRFCNTDGFEWPLTVFVEDALGEVSAWSVEPQTRYRATPVED